MTNNYARLFIKRDPCPLIRREGKVEEIKGMPEFLREGPFYAHPERRNNILHRAKENLLEHSETEIEFPSSELYGIFCNGPKALWSGWRSALVQDPDTKQFYRLKGISFLDEPEVEKHGDAISVLGGQWARNAQNEQFFSDRFNDVLRQEGIEPVMEHVGYYRYPIKTKGRKLAASIVKVKGDTRLDELFFILENLAIEYIDENSRLTNSQKSDFLQEGVDFYYLAGIAVGYYKRLMDKSGQTWSDNSERTNAHIGNVVLYQDGPEKLGIGLVDFDASCDKRDKTKSELADQQKIEYKSLVASAKGLISLRTIGNNWREKEYIFAELRKHFIDGFKDSYANKNIVLLPSLGQRLYIHLLNLFDHLQHCMPFVADEFRQSRGVIHKKDNGLYDILGKIHYNNYRLDNHNTLENLLKGYLKKKSYLNPGKVYKLDLMKYI